MVSVCGNREGDGELGVHSYSSAGCGDVFHLQARRVFEFVRESQNHLGWKKPLEII